MELGPTCAEPGKRLKGGERVLLFGAKEKYLRLTSCWMRRFHYTSKDWGITGEWAEENWLGKERGERWDG